MNAQALSLDDIMTALADPTRRAILDRLASGETRVTDLAQPFPVSLNAISKHIRILERARLVKRRRAGREHLLSLEPRALDDAAAWIASRRAEWNARLDELERLLREEASAEPNRSGTNPTGAWHEHV
jgi:DNA-binding transcriptional ArsR family regulator